MGIPRRRASTDRPGNVEPFLELSDEPCCVVRPGDAFAGVNDAWRDAFGWTDDALTEQRFTELFHPADQASVVGAMRAARAARSTQRGDWKIRSADGGFRECAWRIRCDGEAVYAVARLHAQASERSERDVLGAAFASVGDGVCWIATDGRTVDASDRYVEIVGATRDSVLGSFPPCAGADSAERAYILDLAAAARKGEGRTSEFEFVRADGSPVAVVASGCPLPGAEHALVVLRDLAQQQRTARELETTRGWLNDIGRATGRQLWIGDAAGDAEWVDPRLAETVGEPVEDLLETNFETLIPASLRGPVRAAFDRARRERLPRQIETRLAAPDGAGAPALVSFHPLADDGGRHRGMVATVATAPAGRRDDPSVTTQTELLDVLGAATVALDSTGRICHWSDGLRKLTGFTSADAIGRPAVAWLLPDEARADTLEREEALIRDGSWQGEVHLRRKNGQAAPVYAHIVRPSERLGSVATVAVAIDLSTHKETESRFEDARGYLSAVARSMADGLVALTPDGRVAYMNETAERLLGWTLAELKGREMHATVHYQRADGSGYPADECPVKEAAETGRTITVEDDVATHRNGSLIPVEYTVAPIRTARGSRGVAIVLRDATQRRAAQHRVEEELEALTWVTRLRDALEQDRLVLYAQPIVDLASDEVVRHELLLRMIVDGEVVTAADFLPHAENHSLMGQVDRWVVKQAAQFAAGGASVELNLSAKSIGDPALLAQVEAVLAESGADPSRLIFEITETALIDDEDAARGFAEAMRRLGCGLALDDFGTGYGGFTYLKRLPVQFLKIDREFVRDLPDSQSSVHVVQAVVGLARNFGYKTVAEGVERPDTLQALRVLGVDFAQGYALGRPAPASEVIGTTHDPALGPALAGSGQTIGNGTG
jgi:PAS domain S-box-containing protein